MCLKHPDPKPTMKEGTGYKLVHKTKDGQYECCDYCARAGTVKYPLNQWITDPNDGPAQGCGAPLAYRTGFHISLVAEPLLSMSRGTRPVIKVDFREVTATQTKVEDPYYGKQAVAREIMNLGEDLELDTPESATPTKEGGER